MRKQICTDFLKFAVWDVICVSVAVLISHICNFSRSGVMSAGIIVGMILGIILKSQPTFRDSWDDEPGSHHKIRSKQ